MRIQSRIGPAAALLAMTFVAAVAVADDAPRMVVEIFRVAPGRHAEFLRFVDAWDRANIEAGIPPRQLFVHQNGADWDFLLLQPAELTDEQDAKLTAAVERLGLPRGGKYFLAIREFIAWHSDTTVEGPTTAADWLRKLD